MIQHHQQHHHVKTNLTSIVIDPLPQLASLGQLEGYIQVQNTNKVIIIVTNANVIITIIAIIRISTSTVIKISLLTESAPNFSPASL